MNFTDIFKSDFLENVASIALSDILLAMIASLIMGLYIFYVYKITYRGVLYSSSFGLTLIGLCLITTMLIMTIVSNVVLSLGMVGALSIVRFRTAIKEALDIVFLFWSIATGIVLAAGLIPLALIGGAIIGLVLLLFNHHKQTDAPYLLVLHLNSEYDDNIIKNIIKSQCKKVRLKTKSFQKGQTEIIYELRLLKENEGSFINELEKIPNVMDASLVYYNGDYMS